MILSSLEEQVIKYLDGRKTLVTSKQIVKVLIRSDSYVKSLLLQMEEKGLIKSVRFGSTKLYARQ